MDKTIVIALGGNALSPAGEEGTIAQQFRHTRESLGAVVDLASRADLPSRLAEVGIGREATPSEERE